MKIIFGPSFGLQIYNNVLRKGRWKLNFMDLQYL